MVDLGSEKGAKPTCHETACHVSGPSLSLLSRGALVQLMPHVYWESPFPIKSTNEILQSYSYPSQARHLELGILEQLESSTSTGDRKEMINEFVQHNLLCAVAMILLACMYP